LIEVGSIALARQHALDSAADISHAACRRSLLNPHPSPRLSPMTLTFNLIHRYVQKLKLKCQPVKRIEWKQTDGGQTADGRTLYR